ncbi:transposase [Candidatus Pacearchaeota archaeon]|nr:transposase [Candidatus Pacearchaeota archaeon]
MARPLRIEFPGAWYHVMNRGRRGEKIFRFENDYRAFLDLVQESAEIWNVRISAFCLMDTHYHFLLQTPDGNLSRFMRHVNGVYTQRFNRCHRLDGQLFRGRYKAILVEEDSYLLELLRYIHLNPLRAGVTDKASYKWSSHNGYLSRQKKWDWLNKEFLLAIFAEDISRAKRLYLDFIKDGDSKDILGFFEKVNIPTVLGGDDFVNWVKGKFFTQKRDDNVPESKQLAPTPCRIMEDVCRLYNVETSALLKSRRGSTNEARNVAIYLTRLFCRIPLERIGAEFNISKNSSVSSVVVRLAALLKRDKTLREKVQQLKRTIEKTQERT